MTMTFVCKGCGLYTDVLVLDVHGRLRCPTCRDRKEGTPKMRMIRWSYIGRNRWIGYSRQGHWIAKPMP